MQRPTVSCHTGSYRGREGARTPSASYQQLESDAHESGRGKCIKLWTRFATLLWEVIVMVRIVQNTIDIKKMCCHMNYNCATMSVSL